MALISLNKFQNVITEFIDSQLMPCASSTLQKWALGGGTYLLLQRSDKIIEQYSPTMKMLGLINENNQLDIELSKGFLNAAFEKSPIVELYGIKFSIEDKNALINLLEKYKD